MSLKYTGGGYGGFLPNIPARDLTEAEVKQYGGEAALVATGLYAKPGVSANPPAKPPPPQSGAIDISDGVTDAEASLAGRALNSRKKE